MGFIWSLQQQLVIVLMWKINIIPLKNISALCCHTLDVLGRYKYLHFYIKANFIVLFTVVEHSFSPALIIYCLSRTLGSSISKWEKQTRQTYKHIVVLLTQTPSGKDQVLSNAVVLCSDFTLAATLSTVNKSNISSVCHLSHSIIIKVTRRHCCVILM